MLARALPAGTSLAVLTLLWAVLFLPNAGLPSLYYEEGRHALAAEAMLRDGHWLRPTALGQTFIYKPPLLFWLIAAFGALLGGIGEWAVRLPGLVSVLATALMIAAWLRPRVRPPVAILGAAAYLLNPTILEKAALGEQDTLVTAFSAGAYLLWLGGRHRPGLPRLLGVCLLLMLAAMAKHPIMLGFFGGAAMVVLALERARLVAWLALGAVLAMACLPWALWAAAVREPGDAAQLATVLRLFGPPPGYVLAQLAMLGEFLAEALPWSLLALPALIPPWRRRLKIDGALALPPAAYALTCPALLALWPSGFPRYLMPALPGLVLCAALTVDALWEARWMRRGVLGALALLAVVQLGYRLVALPLYPDWARTTALAAARIEAHIQTRAGAASGPLVIAGLVNFHNIAWYLHPRPRQLHPDAFAGAPRPGWALTAPYALDGVRAAWPDASEALRLDRPYPMILLRIPPP